DRPPELRGGAREEGTHLATVHQPDVGARLQELFGGDPDPRFGQRFGLIYHELNLAWSGLDLARVRPFLSDGLFDSFTYWIEAYRSQGLRNALEGMRVTRWSYARVIRDRYYDAVTVRFWAEGRDFVVRHPGGEVVSGSARRNREYSEYWTFIRGRGAEGSEITVDRSCPNCGAALKVSMSGECAHCGSEITSGRFDWVLSKIEQDEVYAG
ncbi:MAG: TIM44-like domain-containing protein, partial [Acidobacteriota bacterium]